jgi:hypothetical protein
MTETPTTAPPADAALLRECADEFADLALEARLQRETRDFDFYTTRAARLRALAGAMERETSGELLGHVVVDNVNQTVAYVPLTPTDPQVSDAMIDAARAEFPHYGVLITRDDIRRALTAALEVPGD